MLARQLACRYAAGVARSGCGGMLWRCACVCACVARRSLYQVVLCWANRHPRLPTTLSLVCTAGGGGACCGRCDRRH